MWFSKGGLRVMVAPVEDSPEMDEGALEALLKRMGGAERPVVASLGYFTEGARRLAGQCKVRLWDRAHLEEEVGRMVLGELDSRPAAPAGAGLLEPFLRGGVAEALEAAASEAPGDEVSLVPGEEAPLVAVELADGEGMLQPTVTQDIARQTLSDKLEGPFRFELQLVPHYLFSYELEIEAATGAAGRHAGMVLVNAISGEAAPWRPDGSPGKLPAGQARMEPSLDRSEAAIKAMERVVAHNTSVVDTRREERSVTVYEKRTLRPADGAVHLQMKGLLFLPVWCVEGANGVAVLDARTGGLIKRELFNGRPSPVSGAGQ